jgi:hypothetical protein
LALSFVGLSFPFYLFRVLVIRCLFFSPDEMMNRFKPKMFLLCVWPNASLPSVSGFIRLCHAHQAAGTWRGRIILERILLLFIALKNLDL